MSIRKRGPRSYQVRVGTLPARTVPTRADAERLELDLRRRLSLGELYEEAPRNLGHEIAALLARLRVGRSKGHRTLEFYERSARIWARFADRPVATLRRVEVEDFVLARAAVHPRSAKNELEFLKRVLREAKERGQRVDPSPLTIRPVTQRPRRGRALTVSELYEFGSWFPEHVKRLVLVAGQVGARQNVWFKLTDELLDLRGQTLTVPAELAKNRREHRVFLTDVEGNLLREQLLVRPNGTRLCSQRSPASSGRGADFASACGCLLSVTRARATRCSPASRSTCCGIRRGRLWRRLGWIRPRPRSG